MPNSPLLDKEAQEHAQNASAGLSSMLLNQSGTFNFSRNSKKSKYHDCLCDKNANPK